MFFSAWAQAVAALMIIGLIILILAFIISVVALCCSLNTPLLPLIGGLLILAGKSFSCCDELYIKVKKMTKQSQLVSNYGTFAQFQGIRNVQRGLWTNHFLRKLQGKQFIGRSFSSRWMIWTVSKYMGVNLGEIMKHMWAGMLFKLLTWERHKRWCENAEQGMS